MAFRGKFITFEGGEGAGKSTQARHLAEYLRQKGHKVLLTREPGGSAGAELIRNLLVTGAEDRWCPETEVLLMYAARADHWKNQILPALQQEQWVLCDRFADSTVAYQGYGRGVNLNFLEELYKHIIGDYYPDRTYVFDLSPALGLERAKQRFRQQEGAITVQESRFESLDLEFHQRVYQGFLEIMKQNPGRCVRVDATLPIDIIQTILQEDALFLS
jgi:dTMP kinase